MVLFDIMRFESDDAFIAQVHVTENLFLLNISYVTYVKVVHTVTNATSKAAIANSLLAIDYNAWIFSTFLPFVSPAFFPFW